MISMLALMLLCPVVQAVPEKSPRFAVTEEGLLTVMTADGGVLASSIPGAPLVHVTLPGKYEPLSPEGCVLETMGDGATRLLMRRTTAPIYEAVVTLNAKPSQSWISLNASVTNKSGETFECIGFPASLTIPEPKGRYLVYPWNSGGMLPLDERFDRFGIYGQFPLTMGYPGNGASMQFMGVQGPEASFMVMSADRFGSLKRFGMEPGGGQRRILFENQVSLEPGKSITLPGVRLYVFEGGDYADMASAYRSWVQEYERPPGPALARQTVDGVEKIPLQYVSLEEKRVRRPFMDDLFLPHGYPELAMRITPDNKPFAYNPYGMVAEMHRIFEKVYGTKVASQLWTFSRSDLTGGWPLFPVDPLAEAASSFDGFNFPAMTFSDFLSTFSAERRTVFLYTNPTFMGHTSPLFDPGLIFDSTGKGKLQAGGFAAQASEDSYYVSPHLVEEMQVKELRGLAAAPGVMFDSSQAFGGVEFSNSVWRRDPVMEIDRNPKADYTGRYGYTGRDSYVQDRLKRDVALDEATPAALKTGEWVCELSGMYLDINAGSIDLRREYPEETERPVEENMIPLPLYQMVYGGCQYFVIRVSAASDAHIFADNKSTPTNHADLSRRSTDLFGGVHQVLLWGGVRWAGPACLTMNERTYLITRHNMVRRAAFGKQPEYMMLNTNGEPRMEAVREVVWGGDDALLYLDNNTGADADAVVESPLGSVTVKLWGDSGFVPGSLNRMHNGSTLTLGGKGKLLSAWDLSGSIKVGDTRFLIEDSLPQPAGLTIVLDQERLTIANSSPEARHIRFTWRAGCPVEAVQPLPNKTVQSGGAEAVIRYNQATEWSCVETDGVLTVDVQLPAPTPPPAYAPWGKMRVPTTIASFMVGE